MFVGIRIERGANRCGLAPTVTGANGFSPINPRVMRPSRQGGHPQRNAMIQDVIGCLSFCGSRQMGEDRGIKTHLDLSRRLEYFCFGLLRNNI